MRILRALLLAALGCASLASCQLGYIVRQGFGQFGVLWNSRPVADVLSDPAVPAAAKEKLRLIERIVDFGEREIGLKRNGNYTSYLDLNGKPISYNLFACPKTSLAPVSWSFPFLGEISYLGFFDLEDAKEARRELEEDGYDVHLGTVAAYSTLGWFRDPILSSMLDNDEIQLARLLLHEMTHATVYRPGESAFNESVAEFVSEKATALYLDWRFGIESPELAEFRARLQEERQFDAWVSELKEDLEELYEGPLSEEAKIARRKEVFASAQQRLRESDPEGRYEGIEKAELNNAILLAFVTYRSEPELFEAAYRRLGMNLRWTISKLQAIPAGEEAFEFLRRQKIRP